jgi:hypothetical protein
MPIKVTGGIYIDYGCSGITCIDKGIFIPTDRATGDSEKAFQEDLKAFLDRWFPPPVTKECALSAANQTLHFE